MTDRFQELTRAKEWLDAFRPLSADVAEELRHRYEVRLTYHSTAIEGNTLTQSETQIVIEKGITIGGKSVQEHLEVIGHKEALDFVTVLAGDTEPIGEREIREIHSLVMKGQGDAEIGAYRTLDVMAAGTEFRYPSWLTVPDRMAAFSASLSAETEEHPIARAAQAHLEFVTIHPFRDGNGRVGRLLLNLLLLRYGYPIAVIPVERRSEYIDALVAAQMRDERTALIDLIASTVEASLRDVLEVVSTSAQGSAAHPQLVPDIRNWLQI